MISNAKGRHVSPGVYTEEKDVIFSVKSLGITSLGLVGETLYGPAFENIEISEWNDFVDYFGGTSGELYKGTGLPKYELPYIAKSYLSKSKRLNVVKVLGFSGYDAGKCWVAKTRGGKPLIIIRGKKEMGEIGGDICSSNDSVKDIIKTITIKPYNNDTYTTFCPNGSSTTGTSLNIDKKLCIQVSFIDAGIDDEYYNVSLDPRDGDYIYKVISSSPQDSKKSSIYIEEIYENALDDDTISFTQAEEIDNEDYKDYRGKYRCALTPWLVSEVTTFSKDGNSTPAVHNSGDNGGDNGEGGDGRDDGTETPTADEGENGNDRAGCVKCASLKRLFRFLTISDGDASNYQVKVSIEKINPFDGTFDVVVRDFNDTDANINVLEKFAKCSLKKDDASFIGYKIGTSDGLYGNNSKYITVEMATDEDMSGSVPCGFLGYPSPLYGTNYEPVIKYRTDYNPKIKERKQYFGISEVDTDILSFKGRRFYEDDEMTPAYDQSGEMIISTALTYTKGFHMDSIFSSENCLTIYIDGQEETKYSFDSVSAKKLTSDKYAPRMTNARFSSTANTEGEKYMNETIYKNDKLRKFTVCFYGGFDGWDVNRKSRTNTNEYNVNNYGTNENGYDKFTEATLYKLPSYVNTSDYYAYLAGYKVLSNPQDVDINVFATPGIDWYNHKLLTKDAIEVIEDPEDGRGGDALYIMNSPYLDIETGYLFEDVDELAMAFEDTEINSSYACTYAPWILYKDTVRNQYLYLSPTKDVVRNIADTDNTSFPWFAPAGTTRGVVNCEKAQYKTTLEEEDKLYESRINPIKTFGKDGVIVWGNKTAYDLESPLNRINVRRLMIRVKKLVTSAAKHLIFEQYDDALEKQFRGLIEPILADVKANRGIFDYRVVTEVTPETRDQHILPAKIMIKPTPALEYISITFVVYPESVAFEGE